MKLQKGVMELLCLIPKRTKCNKLLIINTLILIALNTLPAKAQNYITVSGKVFDAASKSPLNGATILSKDKVIGHTDVKGHFEFKTSDTSGIFRVTFISYKPQTFQFSDKNNSFPSILLTSSLTSIGEVVISTGYQVLPKERATGSFDQLNNQLINRSSGSNILDRLNGVASGLRFNGSGLTNISTNPGERLLGINIRGETTLSSDVSRDPLIVLDNFPYEGNISNINPNDIESISILKDAAASSIWGARSGNGVIVLTSKIGRKKQPLSIDLNANFTVINKPNLFYDRNFLPSTNYIDVETDLYKKGYFDSYIGDVEEQLPVSPLVDILDKQSKGLISTGDATTQIELLRRNDIRNEYKKFMYRKALQQQYSIGLRGGGEHNSYSASVGYDNNQSNLLRNGFKRFTVNSLDVYNPAKNLEITTGLTYSQNTTDLNNTLGYSGSLNVGGPITGVYPYAQFASKEGIPLAIVKDYRAGYASGAQSLGFLDWTYKPLNEINEADNTTKVYDLILKTSIRYNFGRHLSAVAQYQNESQIVDTRNYHNPETYQARNFYNQFTLFDPATNIAIYQAPKGGILDIGNYQLISQNARFQLNYHQYLNSKNEISGLAGAELRQLSSKGANKSALGYDDKFGTATSNLNYADYFAISPYGYAQFPTPNDAISGTTNRFVSYFANLAYTYDNKYSLTLSGRKDGSNIFGVKTNDRVTPLWSGGLGWSISNEKFYNMEWLPYLKPAF